MSEITINYKGLAIATMDASGAKTLLTQGKYCEGDVEIVYARPSSSPILQSKTKTYTPSGSQQTETVTADNGYDGLSQVGITVNATPSGSVTAPSSVSGTGATVSAGTYKLTLSKTVSVTPNVTQAGYISSGTAGNSNVSLQANVTTKEATTYYTDEYDQYISANTYIKGMQTIKGVTTNNIVAGNIKNGVTIQVGDSSNPSRIASVTGTYGGGGGGWYVLAVEDDGNGNYQFIDDDGDTTFSALYAKLNDANSSTLMVRNATYIRYADQLTWSDDPNDGYIFCSILESIDGDNESYGFVQKGITLNADDTITVDDTDPNTFWLVAGRDRPWQQDPNMEAQPSNVTSGRWFYNSNGLEYGTA